MTWKHELLDYDTTMLLKKEASKQPEVEMSDFMPINWSVFYDINYDIKDNLDA